MSGISDSLWLFHTPVLCLCYSTKRPKFHFFLTYFPPFIPAFHCFLFMVDLCSYVPYFRIALENTNKVCSGLWILIPQWKLNLLSLAFEISFVRMALKHSPFVNMRLAFVSGALFVAASHQTRLDTRSKARRPIKVGIKGRGRSGRSRDSNPACLCCSSAHLVQCKPDEASSFTNPNVGPGTYASLRLKMNKPKNITDFCFVTTDLPRALFREICLE